MDDYWVEKIYNGLVYFKTGDKNLIIPRGIILGKVATGDIVRIDVDEKGEVNSLKVVLKNLTQRPSEL